ncbi:MAG: phosphoglucosamine mutase [Porphyromonadaceae bacterium]|nr:MAG: phosphoglucosamine mutase [Porphyromonadaceae bacterium]
MTLIKSISGIRGTIGGRPGEGLTPLDIVKFTAAFGTWALHQVRATAKRPVMVVGRDARTSGKLVDSIVCSTLNALGIDVVNAGLATTPTVEMAVPYRGAIAGIILTASHNPGQWNALKLVNRHGEFISAQEGEEVLLLAGQEMFEFVAADKLGASTEMDFLPYHIRKVLKLPQVNRDEIICAGITVVVDAVNSVGGVAVPALLEALGIKKIIRLNCKPDGKFAHNPEPLPEHLGKLAEEVLKNKADLGIAVDPDVDRLALVNEDGSFFGEEYTLVAVADYILSKSPGNTVSNLSSSRALRIVTEKYGGSYLATPVGEVNVVNGMKLTRAVIGGEGNGGIILPALHYGRDALVGIALFLSYFAVSGKTMTAIKENFPAFEMAKKKIDLTSGTDIQRIFDGIGNHYKNYPAITSDGLKIEFPEGWVHLRKSNTEPIIRVYSEAGSFEEADQLGNQFVQEILDFVKKC